MKAQSAPESQLRRLGIAVLSVVVVAFALAAHQRTLAAQKTGAWEGMKEPVIPIGFWCHEGACSQGCCTVS
jgi:hypothetical protein